MMRVMRMMMMMMERKSDWGGSWSVLLLLCCGAGQCSGRLRRNKQRRMRILNFLNFELSRLIENS